MSARTELITHIMAREAIPPGTGNPLGAGMAALSKPGNLAQMYRNAETWLTEAIRLMKSAHDCPWKTDEECIEHLLEQVKKRKQDQLLENTT